MNYLVDVNVLSEATKTKPDHRVVDWFADNIGELVVDPIILGEVEGGILSLDRGRKRTQLEHWFDSVVQTIHCVPWDTKVGRRWAALVAEMRKKGRTLAIIDSMIAATALQHKLTLATRNVRHFANIGVKLFDPFA